MDYKFQNTAKCDISCQTLASDLKGGRPTSGICVDPYTEIGIAQQLYDIIVYKKHFQALTNGL